MTGRSDDPNLGSTSDLRDLLWDAVDHVEPEHGPDEVRARATQPTRWVGSGAVTVVAASLATVLALTGAVWLVGGGSRGADVAAGPGTDTGTTSVVAFVRADTPAGPRLAAERREVPTTDDPLSAALEQTVAAQPPASGRSSEAGATPLLPAGTTATAAQTDLGVEVDLRVPGSALTEQSPPDVLAVQALVWTATTAIDSPSAGVSFLVRGEPVDRLFGVDTSAPVTRQVSTEVLAPVIVTSVGSGETLPRTFTVEGLAAAFEGTVTWRLLDGEQVVRDGFATAQECCSPSPYSFDVTAPAGTFTLEVGETDPGDGEGFPAFTQTLQVTVE